MTDYYTLLGVKRSATVKDLRRAFRRLARKFHPDINPGDRAAEVHYLRICEAFEILSQTESRERCDRLGELICKHSIDVAFVGPPILEYIRLARHFVQPPRKIGERY